jgi:hypothetical protein
MLDYSRQSLGSSDYGRTFRSVHSFETRYSWCDYLRRAESMGIAANRWGEIIEVAVTVAVRKSLS